MSERFFLNEDNEIVDKATDRVFNKIDKRLLNFINTQDTMKKKYMEIIGDLKDEIKELKG